jgi:hypothetical protein
VDRHHFDVDTDPYPDPDRHQNDADPHADLTPSFSHVGKSEKNVLLTFTAVPVHIDLSF